MLYTTKLVSLLALAAFATTAASAAPASKDACFKMAFEMAEKAGQKKLPEAQAVKVDELIGKLEASCETEKFAEAETTSKEIDAAIAGN